MQIWFYHAKIFYFVVILYNFEIHHCCKMQKCKKERKKDKYEFMRTRIFILFLFIGGGDEKKGYLLITLENGTFFWLVFLFFFLFFSCFCFLMRIAVKRVMLQWLLNPFLLWPTISRSCLRNHAAWEKLHKALPENKQRKLIYHLVHRMSTTKMDSLYQIGSKMLHSTKVIIFILWHL